jgi:hypothetical protein
MTPHTFRRIAGCYVFLLVFSVAPAAQQKHVPAETTRLIERLELGPDSSVADVGAVPPHLPAPRRARTWRGDFDTIPPC